MRENENTPLTKWIRKRISLGQSYCIGILEEVEDRRSLDDAEIFYIAYFKAIGARLLNCTSGGGSAQEISEDTLQRMREYQRNRTVSHRENLRLALAIRNKDPIIRQRDSDRKRGIPLPDVRRERIVEFNKKKHTDINFITNHANRMRDPDVRKKISTARRGRKASPEARAKMSASHLRRNRFTVSIKINLISSSS